MLFIDTVDFYRRLNQLSENLRIPLDPKDKSLFGKSRNCFSWILHGTENNSRSRNVSKKYVKNSAVTDSVANSEIKGQEYKPIPNLISRNHLNGFTSLGDLNELSGKKRLLKSTKPFDTKKLKGDIKCQN